MQNSQKIPIVFAVLGVLFVSYQTAQFGGLRNVVAVGIGVFAGIALYHASFGFTAAWRRIVTERRGVGLRAQVLLLGLTALCTIPMIGWGDAGGFVQPIGVALVFGSFLFGVGMQLGGGCGSGTLFTVGGGSTRMVITLIFFVIGSMFGIAHASWWRDLPSLGRFSMTTDLGPIPAVLITILLLALIWIGSIIVERKAHGELEKGRQTGPLMTGPWSPWLGAIALAVVGIATVYVLNRPWGITQAFSIWGAKIFYGLGYPIDQVPYWRVSERQIERSVFQSTTSIMNFGIMLGALMAAGLAHKYAPVWRLTRTEVLTAICGGLLMGFGARLSGGCNIGAYLGGVASGSLHAWVWALFAFAGSSLVAYLRMPGSPILRALQKP
ncbi:MAG: YeeE/YedE family protein [Paracoccaceae bacterium]